MSKTEIEDFMKESKVNEPATVEEAPLKTHIKTVHAKSTSSGKN